MPEKISELILWILAVYGLFSLISGALGLIRLKSRLKCGYIKPVLLVRNAEDCIEYVVRNLAAKDFLGGLLPGQKISIVDMNSEDNTYLIAKKLEIDYPHLEALNFDEREYIFDTEAIFSPSPK